MRIALFVLLLSGCALTPTELREQGSRTTFERNAPPVEVATCLGRVIDEYRPFLDARFASEVRPGIAGRFEVRAVVTAAVMVLSEVEPHGAGSRVTIWQSPYCVWPLNEVMAKGC